MASEAPYADWHRSVAHQKGVSSLAAFSMVAPSTPARSFVLYSHGFIPRDGVEQRAFKHFRGLLI